MNCISGFIVLQYYEVKLRLRLKNEHPVLLALRAKFRAATFHYLNSCFPVSGVLNISDTNTAVGEILGRRFDDGSSTHLRNAGLLLDYRAQYPRTLSSSNLHKLNYTVRNLYR
jgi:hypothetical protein